MDIVRRTELPMDMDSIVGAPETAATPTAPVATSGTPVVTATTDEVLPAAMSAAGGTAEYSQRLASPTRSVAGSTTSRTSSANARARAELQIRKMKAVRDRAFVDAELEIIEAELRLQDEMDDDDEDARNAPAVPPSTANIEAVRHSLVNSENIVNSDKVNSEVRLPMDGEQLNTGYGHSNSGQYAHYVFNTLDQDGSGLLSFEEFVTGLSVLSRGTMEEKLRWTFSLYDINGDGYITREEMTDIVTAIYDLMGKLSDPSIDEEAVRCKVERLFNKMDSNGDGVVTLDEFLQCCSTDQEMSRSMAALDSCF